MNVRFLFSVVFATALRSTSLPATVRIRLGGGRCGIQSVRVSDRADTIQGIGNVCSGVQGADVSVCSAWLGFSALLERTDLRFPESRPLTREQRGSLGVPMWSGDDGESRAGRTVQVTPTAPTGPQPPPRVMLVLLRVIWDAHMLATPSARRPRTGRPAGLNTSNGAVDERRNRGCARPRAIAAD